MGSKKNYLASIGLGLLEIKVGPNTLPEPKHVEFDLDNPSPHGC